MGRRRCHRRLRRLQGRQLRQARVLSRGACLPACCGGRLGGWPGPGPGPGRHADRARRQWRRLPVVRPVTQPSHPAAARSCQSDADRCDWCKDGFWLDAKKPAECTPCTPPCVRCASRSTSARQSWPGCCCPVAAPVRRKMVGVGARRPVRTPTPRPHAGPPTHLQLRPRWRYWQGVVRQLCSRLDLQLRQGKVRERQAQEGLIRNSQIG